MSGGADWDNLSADAAISNTIGLIMFCMLFLSLVHHCRSVTETFPNQKWLETFVNYCEKYRTRLLALIIKAYRYRYVSLFLLLAMSVSMISPVSSLMEMEENIVSRSCQNLAEKGTLSPGIDDQQCKQHALSEGNYYMNKSFDLTRNHLLQIALWPLTAAVYGFAIAAFFSVAGKGKPLEEVVELSTHAHHVFGVLLAMVMYFIGWVQNWLGT